MQTARTSGTGSAIWIITACLLVVPTLMLSSCQAQPPQQEQDISAVVEQLNTDIELLETINRLSLSKEQAESLISIAEGLQQTWQARDEQMQPIYAEMVPLLKEKIGYMLRDERIPDELQTQIDAAQARLSAVEDQRIADGLGAVQQAREVFSDPQIMIITGGDHARQAAEEMLIWIRELSDEDFHSEAMPNAEQLADPALGLDVDAVYETFETARDLTPEEYHARSSELAEKLAPLFRTGSADEDTIILELLANERFVPVLTRRAEYLSDGGGAG